MKLKQKNNNNNDDTHILQCFRDQSSIWNQSKKIERFSNKCPKPKTKVIKTAYQKKGNTFKSQWELEAKTTKLSYARENAGDQFLICFSFASDWLRKWGEFFWTNHSAEQRNTKPILDCNRKSIEIVL